MDLTTIAVVLSITCSVVTILGLLVGGVAAWTKLQEGFTNLYKDNAAVREEAKATRSAVTSLELKHHEQREVITEINGNVRHLVAEMDEHKGEDRENFANLGQRIDGERQSRHHLANALQDHGVKIARLEAQVQQRRTAAEGT